MDKTEIEFRHLAKMKEAAENDLMGRLERGTHLLRAVWGLFIAIVSATIWLAIWLSAMRNDINANKRDIESNRRLVNQLYKDRYGFEP